MVDYIWICIVKLNKKKNVLLQEKNINLVLI